MNINTLLWYRMEVHIQVVKQFVAEETVHVNSGLKYHEISYLEFHSVKT
jgi:hypothetical protein